MDAGTREKIQVDFRPIDIKKLEAIGIERDWVRLWENSLSLECNDITNSNQREWHISRISFLKGFELAIAEARKESVEGCPIKDNCGWLSIWKEEGKAEARAEMKKALVPVLEKVLPCENEIPCSVRQAEADLHNEKIEPCPNCRARKAVMEGMKE